MTDSIELQLETLEPTVALLVSASTDLQDDLINFNVGNHRENHGAGILADTLYALGEALREQDVLECRVHALDTWDNGAATAHFIATGHMVAVLLDAPGNPPGWRCLHAVVDRSQFLEAANLVTTHVYARLR